MRGRFSVVLIIAAIAGLIASALVYRTVAQMRAAAARGPQTQDVLVAASNLDVSETVTARDVKLVPWPTLAVPDGAFRKVADSAQSLGANLFEAVSYSPPYWMTISGTSQGGVNGAENLAIAYYGSDAGTLPTISPPSPTSSAQTGASLSIISRL